MVEKSVCVYHETHVNNLPNRARRGGAKREGEERRQEAISRASGLSGQHWCHQTGKIVREKEDSQAKQIYLIFFFLKIQYLQLIIMNGDSKVCLAKTKA